MSLTIKDFENNHYTSSDVPKFVANCLRCNGFRFIENVGPCSIKLNIDDSIGVRGECSTCGFSGKFAFWRNHFTSISKSTGYCENCGQFWNGQGNPTCGCECCVDTDQCRLEER